MVIAENPAVRRLIYTSADDLKTQIRCFEYSGNWPTMAVLEEAHQACVADGQKTKAAHLKSAMRRHGRVKK
jgi:hypothetical protein